MTDATRKLARKRLGLSELDFEDVHQVRGKHQAADVLSHLRTTGRDESRLEDDVLVLTITETQAKGGNAKTNAKRLHSLPINESLDTLKLALSEVLQESDVTDHERQLTKSELVTKQAKDPTIG